MSSPLNSKRPARSALPQAAKREKQHACIPSLANEKFDALNEFIEDEYFILLDRDFKGAKNGEIKASIRSWLKSVQKTSLQTYRLPDVAWGAAFNDPRLYGVFDTSVLRSLLNELQKESWALDDWSELTNMSLMKQARTFAPKESDEINTSDLIFFFNQINWADITHVLTQKSPPINERNFQQTFWLWSNSYVKVLRSSRQASSMPMQYSDYLYVLAKEYTANGYWDLWALQHMTQRFDADFEIELSILADVAQTIDDERSKRLSGALKKMLALN